MGGFFAQIPKVTFRLLIATAVVTIGAVVLQNFGFPLVLKELVLVPEDVVPGLHLWKVVTYAFVTGGDPIGFLFDILVLYSFGSWFERSYGSKRYARFFFFSAIGAALLPVAVGVFSARVAGYSYVGAWAVFEALTVALGILQPGATVNFYMIIPVTARQLMYLSWALIGLFIVFNHTFVPFLPAIGGIGMGFFLVLGTSGPRRLWLRLQSALLERQIRQRSQHLKVVPKDDDPDRKTYLN